MSADAQPRKRKDKRKKKDERSDSIGNEKGPPATPPPPISNAPPPLSSSPDEIMHIYKEGKIGGNMCTKVLFFVIMSALAGTISIVIMQYRGSPDSIIKADESHLSAESSWSIDLGLGDWMISPFSFGSDEGDHAEAHDDHEEQHDGHEEEGHGEEEGHDEHEHEHVEDSGDSGFLSWFGFGGGSEADHATEEIHDDHEEEHEAEGGEGGGFGSWFGWGGGEEAAVEEPVESETEKSSSWFGWGGDTTEETAQETHDEEKGEEDDDKDHESPDDDIDETAGDDEEDTASEEILKPSSYRKYKMEEVDNQDNDDDEDDDDDGNADDTKDSGETPDHDEDDDDERDNDDRDDDEDNEINKSDELGIQQDDDDDDDELATFLRSLDLEPPPRRGQDYGRPVEKRYEPVVNQVEDDDDDEPPQRFDVPDRYSSALKDVDDNDNDDEPDETNLKIKAEEEKKNEQNFRKRKMSKEIEEEEEEELFPEAVEALRLEQEQQYRKQESYEQVVEEDKTAEADEEAPFSRDDEGGDDEAQGANENKVKGEVTDDAPIPVLVKQTPQSSTPSAKAPEPVKEKQFEAKNIAGSAAAKASEFLAERAAERAAREDVLKQVPQPAVKPPPPVAVPVKPSPINFPPPPSLTPEASDEEELSDQGEEIQYSEGEEGVDEEELVEEEERLDEELEEEENIEDLEGEYLGDSPAASDDGGELNLEGSEPEVEEEGVEEEEEEEEESEDEIPPPTVPSKKTGGSVNAPSPAPVPKPTPQPRDYQRRGGPQAYEFEDITDDYDWAIREELDLADEEFNRNASGCLHMYQALQAKHDKSARARVGVAKCLDYLAKEANSNRLLEFAIYAYRRALKLPLKDKLFLDTAATLIIRLRFRGFIDQTIDVHKMIISRFGDVPKHRNDMAISYLMLNNLKEAEKVFNETLSLWPTDAVARAHYGLTIKLQGRHEESIPHLQSGLELDEQATKDARFFFHLGDALVRIGKPHAAEKVYEKGVSLGLFRSKYQRSLYNIDRLKAQPWWTLEETTYTSFFKKLESNWNIIKDEGLKAIQYKKGFLDEAESLRDTGDWKQFELYARGTFKVV